MKKHLIAILLLTATVVSTRAEMPTAESVMATAEQKAEAEHKTVFLHFGASWCGWCKRLDAFLNKPEIKPVFERYYVPVTLDVLERSNNLARENPGGNKYMEKLDGKDSGLPFCLFLNAKGEVIVNSKLNGNNIGYPGEPNEIDYFVVMMKKATPDMPEADLKFLEAALRNASPRQQPKTTASAK